MGHFFLSPHHRYSTYCPSKLPTSITCVVVISPSYFITVLMLLQTFGFLCNMYIVLPLNNETTEKIVARYDMFSASKQPQTTKRLSVVYE